EDGIRDGHVTGVQTCALPISGLGLWLAAQLGSEGPVEVASVACTSSNVAIGSALDLLRTGQVQRVLAGGADALCDFVISGFSSRSEERRVGEEGTSRCGSVS